MVEVFTFIVIALLVVFALAVAIAGLGFILLCIYGVFVLTVVLGRKLSE